MMRYTQASNLQPKEKADKAETVVVTAIRVLEGRIRLAEVNRLATPDSK